LYRDLQCWVASPTKDCRSQITGVLVVRTGWQKSTHHAVATCNDCHVPHDLIGKYLTKAEHGYRHSKGITFQDFHEPIRITDGSMRIVQHNCVRCTVRFNGGWTLLPPKTRKGFMLLRSRRVSWPRRLISAARRRSRLSRPNPLVSQRSRIEFGRIIDPITSVASTFNIVIPQHTDVSPRTSQRDQERRRIRQLSVPAPAIC
jgi:hypothetical protein